MQNVVIPSGNVAQIDKWQFIINWTPILLAPTVF